MSFDPLSPDYPELTPYQFAGNTPIAASDLDGLEILIEVDKGKDFTIFSTALRNPDRSSIHVYMHASQQKLGLSSGATITKSTTTRFGQLLDGTGLYDAKNNGQNVCIILHACLSGRPAHLSSSGEKPIAQTLSETYGKKIIAPDERVSYNATGGFVEVGPRKVTQTDKYSDYIPNVDFSKVEVTGEKGNWLIYQKGVLTSVYGGDWVPKDVPTTQDEATHRKSLSYKVTSGVVDLRSEPNANPSGGTNRIHTFAEGDQFNATGKFKDGWLEVNTSGGKTGWIKPGDNIEAKY